MFPSRPGLAREDGRKRPDARPSTSSLRRPKKDLDARHKAGHDEVGIAGVVVLIATLLPSFALAQIPLAERRSGYDQMSPATKAMQDDDTSNPASLAVLDGEALWKRKVASGEK